VSEAELDDSLLEISRSSVAALDELWSPAGGGDSIALIDTIEDESGPDPEISLEQTEIREALAEAISDRSVEIWPCALRIPPISATKRKPAQRKSACGAAHS
jgi:hypothetical protein